MAKIVTHHLNILESSTVTSTPSADSTYPVYRLYDRHIGRMYIAGSAATTTIHVDQGGSTIQEVDKLIIPAEAQPMPTVLSERLGIIVGTVVVAFLLKNLKESA